jgi:hypothetical protein
VSTELAEKRILALEEQVFDLMRAVAALRKERDELDNKRRDAFLRAQGINPDGTLRPHRFAPMGGRGDDGTPR